MGANHSFSSDCTLFQAASRGEASASPAPRKGAVNSSTTLIALCGKDQPDARALIEVAVNEAKKHLGEFRQPIPIEKLVESVRFHQLFEL